MHKHKCPSCGYVWQHEDMCGNTAYDQYYNTGAFEKGHTCARCGQQGVQDKYYGKFTGPVLSCQSSSASDQGIPLPVSDTLQSLAEALFGRQFEATVKNLPLPCKKGVLVRRGSR